MLGFSTTATPAPASPVESTGFSFVASSSSGGGVGSETAEGGVLSTPEAETGAASPGGLTSLLASFSAPAADTTPVADAGVSSPSIFASLGFQTKGDEALVSDASAFGGGLSSSTEASGAAAESTDGSSLLTGGPSEEELAAAAAAARTTELIQLALGVANVQAAVQEKASIIEEAVSREDYDSAGE